MMPLRRRLIFAGLIAIVAVVLFLALTRHRLATRVPRHVVVIQAVDDATGQALPVSSIEFPPGPQTDVIWPPEVVAVGSNNAQCKWEDDSPHVLRVGSVNHASKEITLDAQTSGTLVVRLSKE